MQYTCIYEVHVHTCTLGFVYNFKNVHIMHLCSRQQLHGGLAGPAIKELILACRQEKNEAVIQHKSNNIHLRTYRYIPITTTTYTFLYYATINIVGTCRFFQVLPPLQIDSPTVFNTNTSTCIYICHVHVHVCTSMHAWVDT